MLHTCILQVLVLWEEHFAQVPCTDGKFMLPITTSRCKQCAVSLHSLGTLQVLEYSGQLNARLSLLSDSFEFTFHAPVDKKNKNKKPTEAEYCLLFESSLFFHL